MKFEMLKPVDVEVCYLDVYPGGRVYPEDFSLDDEEFEDYDEIKTKYPTLFTLPQTSDNDDAELVLRINVNNGHVENWPPGVCGKFVNTKVVDEGTYIIRDNEGKTLNTHNYCYVPECLNIEGEGYGDYFMFIIDENGFIYNWKFTQSDFDELMDISDVD